MFDMKADMRQLFDWNTKLVFIYVTAEYATQINGLNQIVIWDYIIEDIKVRPHAATCWPIAPPPSLDTLLGCSMWTEACMQMCFVCGFNLTPRVCGRAASMPSSLWGAINLCFSQGTTTSTL